MIPHVSHLLNQILFVLLHIVSRRFNILDHINMATPFYACLEKGIDYWVEDFFMRYFRRRSAKLETTSGAFRSIYIFP